MPARFVVGLPTLLFLILLHARGLSLLTMHDFLTLSILGVTGITAATGLTMLCMRRFELAVFFLLMTPLLSSLFIQEKPEAGMVLEASMGGYLRILLLILLGGVGLLTFSKELSYSRQKLPLHFLLLAVFLIMALFSITYSLDPKFTAIRVISFFALFAFLLGLNAWLDNMEKATLALDMLFFGVLFCAILSLLLIVVWPERAWGWGGMARFRGVWPHPNTMGAFCMVAYPIVFWKYSQTGQSGKIFLSVTLCILAVMHLLSGSRTSIVISLMAVFLWFFVTRKFKPLLFICYALAGLLSAMLLFGISFKPSTFEREHSSRLRDLTGRTEIWQAAATLALERPILGYGYAVSGKVFSDSRFLDSERTLWSGSSRTSLHNGYLSVVVGLGFVGLFLFCWLLLIPLWRSIHGYPDEFKAFVVVTMGLCVMTNFLESTITEGNDIVSIIFWVAWVIGGRMWGPDAVVTNEAT